MPRILLSGWPGPSNEKTCMHYVFISRIINPALGYVVTIGNFLARWFGTGFGLLVHVSLWGLALIILGKGTGNRAITNFGTFLSTADPTIAIAGAIILLLTIWLFLTIGGRAFMAYNVVVWFVPLVGAVLAIFLNAGNPFNAATYGNA